MQRVTIWVLIQNIQEPIVAGFRLSGEFREKFIAIFGEKPTEGQLVKHGVPLDDVPHVLNCDGRQGKQYSWYTLTPHTTWTCPEERVAQ